MILSRSLESLESAKAREAHDREIPILPCDDFPAGQERSERCIARYQEIERDEVGAVDLGQ